MGKACKAVGSRREIFRPLGFNPTRLCLCVLVEGEGTRKGTSCDVCTSCVRDLLIPICPLPSRPATLSSWINTALTHFPPLTHTHTPPPLQTATLSSWAPWVSTAHPTLTLRRASSPLNTTDAATLCHTPSRCAVGKGVGVVGFWGGVSGWVY